MAITQAGGNVAVVHHSWFRLLLVSVLLSPDGSGQNIIALPEVQTVALLEKTPHTDATVRISGVVTAVDTSRFYVQDQTGAVVLSRSAEVPLLAPGDGCEIIGTIISRTNGVEMLPKQVIKTGAAQLPPARAMKAGAVSAGQAHHQRVKLTGFVHEVGLNAGDVILALETSGLTVILTWPAVSDGQGTSGPPLDLLDAMVEAEGVPAPQAGSSNGLADLRLLLLGQKDVQVKRPGNEDVFSRPVKPLREMRDPKLDNGERYRVKGKVTFWSDAGWFYFNDGTSSARGNSGTYLRQANGWPHRTPPGYNPPLKPGDEIELVGMRRNLGPPMPSFYHCQWRITSKGELPFYEPVTVDEVVKNFRDGDAVSLVCRLEDLQFMRDYQGFINHHLWSVSDGKPVQVLVQKKKGGQVPIEIGGYFRAHGTVSFSQNSKDPKTAFRLNVNDFTDLVPMRPPPFWQGPVLLRGVAIGIVLLLLGAVWIITLKRQVKAQTAQLQTQLAQEKELSEVKSRFVFTVSHEFRNPLANIMSCSDVLQRMRGIMTPEEHERQIGGIQQNVRRMADMMEDVLLIGRAEAGRLPCEPHPLDVASFCLKLADQIRSASHQRCEIELSIQPDMPRLMLDPALLQHILGNLLSNAVKFSPAGMSVELSADFGGSTVHFQVRDHGAGIPTLDRRHIFEPFQRGSNVGETPGTGLGLAITDRCVRAHGGSIECESNSDEGTTFTVRIPCSVEFPPPSS